MINLFNTHVENLSIHKVGNKNKAEEIFLSENPYSLNDEIMPILKEYFFTYCCASTRAIKDSIVFASALCV